jgi:aspartyl-tRNA(Asn)/glutamyl-tRNA(Gln) amidotransferase subunit A
VTGAHALTATEAAGEIRAGRLTATALVEACLRRIEAVDPAIEAWVTVDRVGALEAAARLDAEARHGQFRGPLHGIPVGLKDIFHAAGLKTTAGARGFADSVPAEDAVCVARLRGAGAVILGKLHTTEFAFADPAVTRNPWHPDRTPGGSSSGSAAAVAARMVPVALGSQTVGSTLRPAAFCGVVGLKPTYGRISRRGVVAVAWSLDHVGIFARSVADAALLLSVMAGHDPGDPGSAAAPIPELGPLLSGVPDRPPRLGVVAAPFRERATTEMRAHLDDVVGRLRSRGARVETVDLPPIAETLISAVQVVVRSEAAAYHADLHREHAEAYRPRIRAAIEAGMCIPVHLYLRAQRVRREARRALGALLARVDALLMPPAPGAAPDRRTTGDASFNAPWSGTGVPQIALPTGLGADWLPLGVQLIGAPLAEARLLAAARWVEAVLGAGAAPPEAPKGGA